MKNIVLTIMFIILFTAKSYAESLETLLVPLRVSDTTGFDRTQEICSTGVPLPYGAIYDTKNIAVYSPDGKTVPAQFRILEKYINKGENQDDGSIKWLLITFMADVKLAKPLNTN